MAPRRFASMTDTNPYASPTSEPAPISPADDDRGLWRDGWYLVVRIWGTTMPQRCFVCDDVVDSPFLVSHVRAKMPIAALLVLLVLLGPVMLLVAMVAWPSARVRTPLCRTHRAREFAARRRTQALLIIGMLLFGGGLFTLTEVFAPVSAWTSRILLSGVGFLTAAAAHGMFRRKPLEAIKVDHSFAWLANIPESLLDSVPEVPSDATGERRQ